MFPFIMQVMCLEKICVHKIVKALCDIYFKIIYNSAALLCKNVCKKKMQTKVVLPWKQTPVKYKNVLAQNILNWQRLL